MNRATLYGRIGGDPEIRTMQSGDKVANFSLATSERWKDRNTGEKKERTEWHRIVVWGALADVAERFLRKGSRAIVEGAIRTRKWQDQSGQDRYSTEIVLSGYGARLDVIDWPDGDAKADGQDAASRDDLDDEIPF